MSKAWVEDYVFTCAVCQWGGGGGRWGWCLGSRRNHWWSSAPASSVAVATEGALHLEKTGSMERIKLLSNFITVLNLSRNQFLCKCPPPFFDSWFCCSVRFSVTIQSCGIMHCMVLLHVVLLLSLSSSFWCDSILHVPLALPVFSGESVFLFC